MHVDIPAGTPFQIAADELLDALTYVCEGRDLNDLIRTGPGAVLRFHSVAGGIAFYSMIFLGDVTVRVHDYKRLGIFNKK